MNMTTTKRKMVEYSLFRKTMAPECTASEISIMRSVPRGSRLTEKYRRRAKASPPIPTRKE